MNREINISRQRELERLPEGNATRKSESFWANVGRQFRKNRLAVYSLKFIILLAIIAALADFLANEKPIVASYQGETCFPVFRGYAVDLGWMQWQKEFRNVIWDHLEFDWAIWPPVPYLPSNIDYANAQYSSPFDDQVVKSMHRRHWLGTDKLGHDVLAGMIHGTRIALLVGLVAMAIASVIGILLGSLAGYFGDDRLKISRIRLLMNLLFILLAMFYAFGSRSYILSDAINDSFGTFFIEMLFSLLIFIIIMILGNVVAFPLKMIPFLARKVTVPVDIIISRMIEVMLSIPTLYLIITVIAVARPSVFTVMVVIGLTTWTGIARFMRGEMLRIRTLEYMEAAQVLGFSEMRAVVRHAIPNALSPVLIAIAFGIAGAILIEAVLSFLGLTPTEVVTWGKLLYEARINPSAWWLAVIPGMAIFLTVTVYNLVGEGLTDAMDPKLRK